MNKICEKKKCTGCFACFNICPKNAIKMIEDDFGRIYPIIDEDKCINCGLCKKTCPQLNDVKYNEPITAYALYNKDKKIRNDSTSGGAATTFYLKVLESGGIIYGANNIENERFKFIRITNQSDLYKVKGSKYVHCYIDNMFLKVQEDLKNNNQVLFIGTPCQIAGLKLFLKKEYENLLTVDLICHGVPTQKFLNDELKLHVKDTNLISSVKFRDGSSKVFIIEKNDNNCIYKESWDTNYYLYRFLNSMIFRENCYECKYAKKQRVSDITIGDFWGLKSQNKYFKDDKKGISLVMPNTEKGKYFVEKCLRDVIYEERPLDEAINGNSQLQLPAKKHKNYNKFFKYYKKFGYEKACKKTRTFKQHLKQVKIISNIYHRIKGRKYE
ncbi:MAG: Coenzyme F420 hydrogenase/dehydrogenase, beta subunit C-terminal domain [Bacilli bacterium]|nr:Coenzyme F420 hydrogenase/dehydrogenase, beta subunit C-terminal domain [Bacilli bacterium]